MGQRPEVGGAFERGRDIPSVVVRDPKPLKDGKMERDSDCGGLGHEPVARSSGGDDFRIRAAFATLPQYTRDRALTGGEAAPLDQPGRASHRSGHDDAKALLQAHRHLVSRGSRRTGDAELFAGGQDA